MNVREPSAREMKSATNNNLIYQKETCKIKFVFFQERLTFLKI